MIPRSVRLPYRSFFFSKLSAKGLSRPEKLSDWGIDAGTRVTLDPFMGKPSSRSQTSQLGRGGCREATFEPSGQHPAGGGPELCQARHPEGGDSVVFRKKSSSQGAN